MIATRPVETARQRFRLGVLAAITAAALVLTACVPADSGSGSAEAEGAQGLVDRLRALPFGDDAIGAVDEVLEDAGVLVQDEWDPDASEVVRVSAWQRVNLAAEAANGGGLTGAELEEIVPVPEGSPPVAYLVAAWALEFESPGAEFSRALLGDQDYSRSDRVVFPMLVITLFLADATADIDATTLEVAAARSAGDMPLARASVPEGESVATGVCSAVSHFVQNAIATVANALKVSAAKGGILGFLGKIWNAAVDLVAGVVAGLIDFVTRPVVDRIVMVFSLIETIRQVSTLLLEWRATLTLEPDANRFGIDGEVVTGDMTVQVHDNRIPIPPFIVECAAAFDVDLRSAGSAAGSRITWHLDNQGRDDLTAQLSADEVLDDDQSGTFTYATGQESAEIAATGEEHAGSAWMHVSIARNDIERIRQLFLHVTLHAIPDGIRPFVEPFVSPVLNAATQHIARFTDVRTRDAVIVQYHGQPEEDEQGVEAIVIPSQCPTAAEVGPGFYDFEGYLPGQEWCNYTAPSWADPPWEYYLVIYLTQPSAVEWVPVDYPGADFAGQYCGQDAGCEVYVRSGDRHFFLLGAPTPEAAWEITDRVLRAQEEPAG